jgi:hypothetical protein
MPAAKPHLFLSCRSFYYAATRQSDFQHQPKSTIAKAAIDILSNDWYMDAFMNHVALVVELHPAQNVRSGTSHLIKTCLSYPYHPFCAIVAADQPGPDPVSGPWDAVPTLSLFRPRSILHRARLGLAILDNVSFRLQRNRVSRFLERYQAKRQLVMVANNPRLAMFAADSSGQMPRDVYIIDDFVADSRIYKISQSSARSALDRLVMDSDRIFTISPLFAVELEAQYNKPCHFLPLPISDTLLKSIVTMVGSVPRAASDNQERDSITIHHSGAIHHLYADALTELVKIFREISESHKLHIRLELWGRMTAKYVSRAIKADVVGTRIGKWFDIKLCGEVSPIELVLQQQRADFLLLANSFLPQYERQIKCSFSSKACEYMVSGVPILLYAPTYSSLTAHLSKYNAAHIVSAPDHNEAREQIAQILFDPERDRTAEAAQSLAMNLHSTRVFFNLLYP